MVIIKIFAVLVITMFLKEILKTFYYDNIFHFINLNKIIKNAEISVDKKFFYMQFIFIPLALIEHTLIYLFHLYILNTILEGLISLIIILHAYMLFSLFKDIDFRQQKIKKDINGIIERAKIIKNLTSNSESLNFIIDNLRLLEQAIQFNQNIHFKLFQNKEDAIASSPGVSIIRLYCYQLEITLLSIIGIYEYLFNANVTYLNITIILLILFSFFATQKKVLKLIISYILIFAIILISYFIFHININTLYWIAIIICGIFSILTILIILFDIYHRIVYKCPAGYEEEIIYNK